MKEAVGYVTSDDKFFESMDEAEEHEAYEDLKHAFNGVGLDVDMHRFLVVLAAIPNEIRRYINANEAASRCRQIQASLSTEDQTGREVSNEAVLEQSADRNEPLPNMGSGKLEEEIQFECSVHGVGGGRVDASSVRSSEDLATGTHTEPTKARRRGRKPDFRQGKMD